MRNFIYIFGVLIGSLSAYAEAQTVVPLSYSRFLQRVNEGNREYAAEKLNVNAARADAVAAKVFDDPELSVSYSNNQDNTIQMGQSVEFGLTQTVTLGRRRAGIRLAKSQSELSEILLEDYYRNLRADATIAYLEALKRQQLFEVKKKAYQNMADLAKSDSMRFVLGKIMEVEATQSHLEAGMMYNEVLQAETELNNACASLSLLMGRAYNDTLYRPDDNLRHPERDFALADLMEQAVDNRSDLLAARKNSEVASRELTLVRRERRPDVDVSLNVSLNNRVRNEEAPAPPYTGVTAGVAFPLNFSALNKGALRAAKYRAQQAELQSEHVRMQVENEVMQAYWLYQSHARQVAHYEKGLLEHAETVLKGKIYSYNRGEVSLLEILNAQRTYNDVQAQYIQTLFDYNTALVELERSVGIWDIN